MELFETKDSQRIKKLETFNLGLANENAKMRELLESSMAAYCGHRADVDRKTALHSAMVQIEKFLDT